MDTAGTQVIYNGEAKPSAFWNQDTDPKIAYFYMQKYNNIWLLRKWIKAFWGNPLIDLNGLRLQTTASPCEKRNKINIAIID